MRPLPETAKDLIEDLEANYKPRCKAPHEDAEEHAFYAGQVALVEVLRQRYDWTQQNLRIETKGLL